MLEERRVRVSDPELSPEANRRLTAEVRDVIGTDRVHVPRSRPHPSRGERPPGSRLLAELTTHRMVLTEGIAGGIVGGLIIALITNLWWVLPIAVAVLWVATAAVLAVVLHMTSIREHPSPTAAAMMEEEGVRDPERHFAAIVEEFTEDEGGQGEGRRTVAVEDDPVKAAAEQQSATTATGGPSAPVGPGSPPDS